jgi:hypothetical protein
MTSREWFRASRGKAGDERANSWQNLHQRHADRRGRGDARVDRHAARDQFGRGLADTLGAAGQ